MNDLHEIIEEVGLLNDSAEASKWQVAQKIADAFAEFKPYERGLTQGLCQRLRKSSDTIYGMRNAEELRVRLNSPASLSVSHFSVLHELQTRYELSDDNCKDWIARSLEDSLSVRDMRSEVALEHEQDARTHWKLKISRMVKLMTRILQDAESVGVTNEIYQATKTASSVARDLAVLVEGWKS